MKRWAPSLLLVAAGLAAGALAGAPGVAEAERMQEGNLIVSLNARLTPRELPRVGQAPASVRLLARFATSDGSRVPQLRRMAIVLGTRGAFDTSLPVCRLARIRDTTARQALRACRPSLIGHGRMNADLFLKGQRGTGFQGRILAFNGVAEDGTPLILADVHGKNPPVSFVMAFRVRPIPGTAATALVANLPQSAGSWTHVRRFQLTLGRRFEKGGRMHSFVNASCPAPPRFSGLVFTFAEATYGFAGGREVSTAVVRGCRVRKGAAS
jgi:hypothetical protein